MTSPLPTRLAPWLPGDDLHLLEAATIPLVTSAALLSVATPPGHDPAHVEVVEDEAGRVTVTVETVGRVRVTALVPTVDAVALWRPGSDRDNTSIPASWEDAETVSPMSGMVLGALLGPRDRTIVAYGFESGDDAVAVRVGMVEETSELLLSFDVESTDGVAVRAHLDLTGRTFPEAVQAMGRRLTGPRPPVRMVDERPVLCTWYFAHQELDGSALLGLAAPAAALGFGSVIIDDGWQTTGSTRGYGSAGDWEVAPTKIDDPRGVVRTFADHGLRTLWWIGTPFIGHRSVGSRSVPTVSDDSDLDAGVLDPRAPEARARLVDRVTRLLRDTGAHGVKLDFLERFAAARVPAGVEQAALALLDDLGESLRAVRPDLSVEFREPYFGPTATEFASMIRVGDCPMSPARNRTGIVDLRLATNGIAVHSDPVMWAPGDSPERVAQHLQNTLFGVPQVSVDLRSVREDHERVLGFWLAFAERHRDVLLHGEFRPTRPDLRYPVVHAEREGHVITVRYQPVAVEVPGGDWHRWDVVNADAAGIDLHAHSSPSVDVVVFDAQGRSVESFRGALPSSLPVPTGGRAEIERA